MFTRTSSTLVALALALTACKTDIAPPSDIALRSFSSCGDLRDYAEDTILEQLVQSRYTYWYYDTAAPESDGAANDDSSGRDSPSDYTTTNVQEQGVDEIDIVKTDGNHIYTVNGSELHIVKSWPIADTALVSTLDLDGWAYGLFLYEDQLAVVSWFYDETGVTNRWWGGTRVTYVDISDRAAPRVTRSIDFEGWMADARLIDEHAYLVMNTWLPVPQAAWDLLWSDDLELPEMDWDASEADQAESREEARELLRPHIRRIVNDLPLSELLPVHRDNVVGEAPGSTEPLLGCTDVYRPAEVSHYAVMSIVRLDLDNGDLSATGVMSDGWQVYASRTNLYVAQTSWWWWWGWNDLDLTTNIHKFDLTGDKPAYVAAGQVDGWLLNQFSMSEYDGHLRVASTEFTNWWGAEPDEDSGSNVTILKDDDAGTLAEVGAVTGIAPGEQITAVRMLGDVGYVVTYLWVDPLFTIDLSDPTAPAVLGELKLPGFSTYLHPLGDDHLLAVGYAGTDEGVITGLAINVFDVSDLSAPRLAHQYTLESDDWSYSEALWDHHAFTYHRDVLSIPIYTYDYDESTGAWSGFSGMLVTHVTTDGIEELGRVDHADLVSDSACDTGNGGGGEVVEGSEGEGDVASDDTSEPYCYWYAWMRRSVYVEDNLFSISDYGMKVNDLDEPEIEHARVVFHPAN